MDTKLSASLEDYLEAIAQLIEVDGHAHTKKIATKLGVKMPSVTGALRTLDSRGYIVYVTSRPVELTPMGRVVADMVINRHNELKRFFCNILGLNVDVATKSACHLEHVVDDETLSRFTLFSNAIESRCDAQKLKIYLTEAFEVHQKYADKRLKLLSQLQANDEGRVVKIGRNVPLSEQASFAVDSTLKVQGFTLDRSSIKLLVADTTVDISMESAENIWVIEE